MQVAVFRKRYIDVSKDILFTPINTSYTNHPNIGAPAHVKPQLSVKPTVFSSPGDAIDFLKSLKIEGVVFSEFARLMHLDLDNPGNIDISALAVNIRSAIKNDPSKFMFLDDGKIYVPKELFESIFSNLGKQAPSHHQARMPIIKIVMPAL